MIMKTDNIIKISFWGLVAVILCICSYFILHNAAWLLGDDCQTLIYTGWDKPIFGFFVSPTLGRFFPLDYTIYNVLCLFYEGQIPPSAHYFIHVLCFFLYIIAFIALSLYILKDKKAIWKYSTALMVVLLVVGRTYLNFMQCWTGIWTIFTFLPLFMYGTIKFLATKKWGYAILALLSINYILYYYETMFTIPIALGVCALVFSHKKSSIEEKVYNYLLIASGLLFLLLYAILVLPKVETFYAHHLEVSPLVNAAKMFFAQKIMWLVVVLLVIRLIGFVKKTAEFNFYDNLLLASCAYCCGSAFLGLNYTLYYTPAVIVAIPAILYFSKEYLSEKWVLGLFILLALFYVRKVPSQILDTQNARIGTYAKVHQLIDEIGNQTVYFYEPSETPLQEWEIPIRGWRKYCLEEVTGWYMKEPNFDIVRINHFANQIGLWQVVEADQENFLNVCPTAEEVVDFNDFKIFKVK